ncbi:AcvB/VirJ family lysyl-phosphatidylglycerol hydrolase [Novosphingobium nitrogenifigens]|uniref:AcvB/VirJ family lysyl-phosphatidylglycerol hydrolase n=1 Tax=Novosphingobium nitrogenifigens TaxID=378548 RepID=UPI0003186228|nr:AcvB/VirJ family lysyl-phosphatidylglycerol hydrolase [Novosphingobium nitrogenifigens]
MSLAPLLVLVMMALGGYFDLKPRRWFDATAPRRHDLVAVYFSGDMGLDIGANARTIDAFRARGVPVLAINSSALFLHRRDRAYVDTLVADSIRDALTRSGANRIVLIGGSFGADILDTGAGVLPADLRARIASVVLIVPGTQVFFHANPLGFFYSGQPDSDPRRTVRLLHGLPVTCIYGTSESDSLCRDGELAHARRIAIADGHMMLAHYRELVSASVDAALSPPATLQ